MARPHEGKTRQRAPSGDLPKKLEESETRAAAASLAKALAAKIHPDSSKPEPPPAAEAGGEEGTTTDSDCMIVDAPAPKKPKH